MDSVIFLFLRQMRAPLLVLVSAYTISIGVLVLIPGTDAQGQVWYFDFFHALYFISLTGPTIGFGEIPHDFNAAQRMWTTVAIYLTVVAWLYAIGKILTLIQDPAFKRAVTEQRFARHVRHLSSPFYLVCGYGDTGSLLVRALTRRAVRTVVIDTDQQKLDRLYLENLSFDVPTLCADAREDRVLLEAGLRHPQCAGVLALTDVSQANVKISVVSKLLRPGLKVVSRAENRDTIANLASFNTDHIINPFNIFAAHLAIILRAPSVHQLHQWLTGLAGQPLTSRVEPPRGAWVICGFGRFGQAVASHLQYEGIPVTVVTANPEECPDNGVLGVGTEAVTLRAAGIHRAVAIVAGTNADADNLSIIMTARTLNPDLYLVARLNRRRNEAIFQSAGLDLVMQGSRMIVWRILPLLTQPVLSRFLHLARHHNETWANEVIQRISAICGDGLPQTWTIRITASEAPALHQALAAGQRVRLSHLLSDPRDRHQRLPCVVLMRKHGKLEKLLPDGEEMLELGDALLCCAPLGVSRRMAWCLVNANVLEYLISGTERPDGYLWRWWARRQARRASPSNDGVA